MITTQLLRIGNEQWIAAWYEWCGRRVIGDNSFCALDDMSRKYQASLTKQ